MAARATEAMVKEIINTTLTEEEVAPFLRAANALVTDMLSAEGYGVTTLSEIERWLAAHFVAIRDPQVSKEKIGAADATYHGKSGLGLDHTPYGQQVKIMDYHGIIAKAESSRGPAIVETIDWDL